jgi:4-carboxymuconolactone decarboxylase
MNMPRVELLERDQIPDDNQHYYDEIAKYRGHVARPFKALLNSPTIATKIASLGEELRYVSPTISPEIREIVTLTIAKTLKCEYVWTHHIDSAQEIGVRVEVIEAIKNNIPPRKLLPKEGVFVQFTKELLENAKISNPTYSAVDHLLGQKAIIDLISIIGYYNMLCLSINGLEIDLEDGVNPQLNE